MLHLQPDSTLQGGKYRIGKEWTFLSYNNPAGSYNEPAGILSWVEKAVPLHRQLKKVQEDEESN